MEIIVLTTIRDFAQGLSRGFGLFFSERQEVAVTALMMRPTETRK